MPQETPNPNPKDHQATGSKRKRNLPGTPDPDAEVVSLSPKTLLSATTFVCEVCGKEFRRDQNLQIHRRGHNLPWKHSPKSSPSAKKRVYVCPEVTCVYHEPSRALGDLTGIKKHYSRKHGEKKWECDKCSKKYAVRTDWKAHSRVCGNREYECLPCGTLFSKKESFLIHKTSCEASASASASAAEEEATYGEEEEEDSRRTRTIDFGVKANTVNNELMFPSLWGKVSEPPETATKRGGEEETQSK